MQSHQHRHFAKPHRRGALTAGRAAAAVLIAVSFSAPVSAQQSGDPVSRAVVQPLPPEGTSQLNEALRRLARDSRDVDALIDAGNASLTIDDVEAAIGFFGRAQELSPGNPRVKIGLAGAYVRRQRPIDALRLFDEAQAAGASTDSLAADRAMAYDLVGDNEAAASYYREALARRENPDTRRQLALSHAIAGNREAFEAVLYPLIEKEDFAAYRTRAFGLAILGDEDEAIAITEAVMPRDLSARIAPYLRYMPRLTKAQQAAAANFGVFPRAAQIGRDTPQIAQYAGRTGSRSPDARLAPQGEPLGRRTADNSSPRRRPDRGSSSVDAEPAITEAEAARLAKADRAAASDPMARSRAPTRVRVRRDTESEEPQAAIPVPATPPATAPTNLTENAAPARAARGELAPTAAQPVPTVSQPVVQPAAPVVIAAIEPAQSGRSDQTDAGATTASPAAANFDLANVERSPARPATDTAASQTAGSDDSDPAPASVADAFADFSFEPSAAEVPVGGVDITTIKPRREVERAATAQPEKPQHPRRFWVQIATGQDRDRLKFDWRRLSRNADGALDAFSPHAATWGQSNRLLAGPYDSQSAARNAVNSLKNSGVDSFTFTSAEGEVVDKL
ncbi:SPOR domain-containing protein [Pontixanthobacter aquaemixtae]|uniref:Tetratricopeptide repeat protein n=1 Tax=Pontixanthobacter aquaemixtae TaxID=1958940 RepID=A0A844ZPS4_9SPHN|nr:SPOR domain-containing protein [Pontixanthobacter aquaemixtae]MXO89554.1 tetratricopeptide repeat protein [Pontixanthobacter aquaemixtae]